MEADCTTIDQVASQIHGTELVLFAAVEESFVWWDIKDFSLEDSSFQPPPFLSLVDVRDWEVLNASVAPVNVSSREDFFHLLLFYVCFCFDFSPSSSSFLFFLIPFFLSFLFFCLFSSPTPPLNPHLNF